MLGSGRWRHRRGRQRWAGDDTRRSRSSRRLREAEVAQANGKTVAEIIRDLGISEQTYYRWRKEYGGMKVDQARQLKELQKENARLKRAVANLTLDKLILEEAAKGNF